MYPGTDGNHATFSQVRNKGSNANSQEIMASMENLRPEGNEYQSVTSPSGEYLGRNFNVRSSNHIRKSPHRYNPGFGAAREWKSDAIVSLDIYIQIRSYT